MFGAFYFGQPYFSQILIPGFSLSVSASLRWFLHRFDLRPRQEETQ